MDKFEEYLQQIGDDENVELRNFVRNSLTDDKTISWMQCVSSHGYPAVMELGRIIKDHLELEKIDDNDKRIIGKAVRACMEINDYEFIKTGVNVPPPNLFRTGAIYKPKKK